MTWMELEVIVEAFHSYIHGWGEDKVWRQGATGR